VWTVASALPFGGARTEMETNFHKETNIAVDKF
jgi:hypothetical protein